MKKRTIGIFTGNRAEYGLQFPIIEAIKANPNLDYRLYVSGAHLESTFGNTINEIEADGNVAYAKILIPMQEDGKTTTAHAIGSGVIEISKALQVDPPDIFVVYADRFEGFAAVIAATQMNIPTAHIEGGDLTEGGALDDSVRHAMTKLSHLHFATNQQSANRILAMGEEPWRVHLVGLPAIDGIKKKNYYTRPEVLSKLNLDISRPIVVFTQHSVTSEPEISGTHIDKSLAALKKLANEGVQIIITYPNNDVGSREIIERIEQCRADPSGNIKVYKSLGRKLYHGLFALAFDEKVQITCAGNSSSGIKETPAFFMPTVNIGTRQAGRLQAKNVLNVNCETKDIVSAINKALTDSVFRKFCREAFNPYGVGDSGTKIANILELVELENILNKKMTLKGEGQKGWWR
jgi:UDP-N-acetylglucosamine 2-epimerase (non-hydrolysing)/GDP/UDP-N,N'-diacetylbacillosamine 2-epimerase (hydrolysing)